MAQLRQRYEEVKSAGGEVLMISSAPLEYLERYVRELRLPFVALSDTERKAYRAYGLKSASFFKVYSPSVLWGYVKMILGGERLRKPVGDTLQLGGDFVVDGEGVLRLVHPSRSADDRPPIDELVSLVKQLA